MSMARVARGDPTAIFPSPTYFPQIPSFPSHGVSSASSNSWLYDVGKEYISNVTKDVSTDTYFFILPFAIMFFLSGLRRVLGSKKSVQVKQVINKPTSLHEDKNVIASDNGFRPGSALMLAVRSVLRGAKSLFFPSPKPAPHKLVKELVFPAQLVHTCETLELKDQPSISLPIRLMFKFLSVLLDALYSYRRPLPRFWFLETVARMPYFAYNSALHLYETLGWWRTPQLRTLHFAEENNELHHLLIMEALGGDKSLLDRIIVQPVAVLYYWLLVLIFFFSPSHAYEFCRLVESHAAATYNAFCIANRKLLKQIPAPVVARQYYLCTGGQDRFLFDRFHVDDSSSRTPKCETLLDTFINVRDDEREHVQAMIACENWTAGSTSQLPV